MPKNHDINLAALNLGFIVKGDPSDKKKGNAAIIDLKEKDSLLKQLSLVYYGNQLGVYFSIESMLGHAYTLISKKTNNPIVDIDELVSCSKLIFTIFQNEFLPLKDEVIDDRFRNCIKSTIKQHVFIKENENSLSLSPI